MSFAQNPSLTRNPGSASRRRSAHSLQPSAAIKNRMRGEMSLRERFDEKYQIVEPGGCWVWMAASSGKEKYGVIWSDGLMVGAHRVSWELHKGPIPEGMQVCHHCDNPPCVNPAHLFLGTQTDNMQDCARKGRTNVYCGESHPSSKLTDKQIAEIRGLAGKLSQRKIAARFGISKGSIHRLVHHQRRANLHSTSEGVPGDRTSSGAGGKLAAEHAAQRGSEALACSCPPLHAPVAWGAPP